MVSISDWWHYSSFYLPQPLKVRSHRTKAITERISHGFVLTSTLQSEKTVGMVGKNMVFGFDWSDSGIFTMNDSECENEHFCLMFSLLRETVKPSAPSFSVNKPPYRHVSRGTMFTHLINKTLTPPDRKKNKVTVANSNNPEHGHKVK